MADTEGTKEEGEDDKAISANQGLKDSNHYYVW